LKYCQCFVCRMWSWDVSRVLRNNVHLCLPCYVDVLEVRQARGVMGEAERPKLKPCISETLGDDEPGNSPSPILQIDLFDS